MGVNFQQSYNLGNDYGDIRDRATKMLGNFMEYENLIKFNDIDRSLTFTTERLFPIKSSKRPKILLLFSNPHPHSIQQGMFLSSNTKNRENLFWPTMRDAGWFSVPESKQNPSQRRDIFLQVEYSGPFELYFYCYYAFPTAYPDHIPKILGRNFFKEIIEPEAKEEFRKTAKETGINAIIVYNKSIFNLIADEKIDKYIDRLNGGRLVHSKFRGSGQSIPIYLTYPTGWRYHKNYMKLRIDNLEKIRAEIIQHIVL